jgi:Glycosyl transferases group 1
VSLVTAVEVPRRSVSLLEPIIGGPRYLRLVRAADQVRQLQAGRTIWNINSTAAGGGVADHVVPGGGGYLVLAGPAVTGVSDDPEGAAIFGECLLQWRDLPPAARARILLVTLPLDDIDENAAMVNALQWHATVIAQKSLAEGFGLTVSEGMWKGRPVIGSAVGGIIDQIVPGTGILLPDATDLKAFGRAVRLLLADRAEATRLGLAAHAYVRENYLGDVHLLRYARLLGTLVFEDLSLRRGRRTREPQDVLRGTPGLDP